MASLFVKGLSIQENNNLYLGYLNHVPLSPPALNLATDGTAFFLWKYLGPVVTNNFMVLLALVLSLVFGYRLFNKVSLGSNKLLSLLFSITWALSPYFLFRVISATVALYFVFVFPLLFYFLYKEKNNLYMGVFTLCVFQISAYYGYFTFLTILFWDLSGAIIDLIKFKKFPATVYFKKLLAFGTPLIFGILLIYGSLFWANFKLSSKYEKPNLNRTTATTTVYRPVEDFYNFTLRPWYFFIPPKSSLFFSDYSNKVYTNIESTNYYLADDYHDSEMGGSYIGLPFAFGMLIFIFLLIKKVPIAEFDKKLFLTLIFILLFTGPPSFTVSGLTFYTPSFLLFQLLPGFRVLARFAALLFLIVMILNFKLLIKISDSRIRIALGIFVFCANFIFLSVNVPIVDLTNPAVKYKFLNTLLNKPAVLLVLPEPTFDDTFWILHHKNYLFNPKGFVNQNQAFNSEAFTNSVLTSENSELKKLNELGIDFVILNLNSSYPKLAQLTTTLGQTFGTPVYTDSSTIIYQAN